MNNKIAMALIIGALFAIAVAYYTAEVEYYVYYHSNYKYTRVTPEFFKDFDSKWTDTKTVYIPMFIVIGFLGGMGTGYLTASALEAGLSRLKKRKLPPAIPEK